MEVIRTKNLQKHYGGVQALRGISFVVNEGEIFGLLGPNGAGKTTTLEILEGLRLADGGEIEVLGFDPARDQPKIEQKVGMVLQKTGMLPYLTVEELLDLFSSFYQEPAPLPGLIKQLRLKNFLSQRYDQLSGGQRQRLVLALALLQKPKVLFLDEPTIGLDPAARQNFWEVIHSLRERGMTIVMTTHYMEEAQVLCDRVAIIDRGKILLNDRPVKLINDIEAVSRVSFVSSKPINVADLEQLPKVISARKSRYSYDLETLDAQETLRYLLEWAGHFSGKIFNLEVHQATLEDVFLKLTGRHLRD